MNNTPIVNWTYSQLFAPLAAQKSRSETVICEKLSIRPYARVLELFSQLEERLMSVHSGSRERPGVYSGPAFINFGFADPRRLFEARRLNGARPLNGAIRYLDRCFYITSSFWGHISRRLVRYGAVFRKRLVRFGAVFRRRLVRFGAVFRSS